MKKSLFDWIHPLQMRTSDKEIVEETGFFKMFHIVYPILLYYLICNFCILFFASFLQWIATKDGVLGNLAESIREYSVMTSAAVNGISMLLGVLAIFPFFKRKKLRIGFGRECRKDAFLLFIGGAAIALCVNILFGLLGITENSQTYTEVAGRQFALPLWAGIVLYGVISPIAEEMVFRGILYNGLHQYFGRTFAIIGSALVFGLYHGNMVQALYGFILGVVIALFYERYGSFAVTVLLHSAANICVYVASKTEVLRNIENRMEICAGSGVLSLFILVYCFYDKKKKSFE